jgi:protoheme ferro-lyase
MVVLISIAIVLIIAVAFLYGLYKIKNRPRKPDYFEYYKTQDKVPVGKVGVFANALIMPEDHSQVFWHNIPYKIFNQVIPWPFRLLAFKDKGLALKDPSHMHAAAEFTPTHLVDHHGREHAHDGFPYMEKYKQGKLKWVPPSRMLYLDHGYFLYDEHFAGQPTVVSKMANFSKHHYYGNGTVQGKIPHWQGSFEIIDGTFKRLKQTYPNAAFRAETSLFHYSVKQKLHQLLEEGCDTIVLVAPMAIYSHFEEFNSGFRHCFEDIEEWEKEHPGKKIKVIIAPQMGDFQALRQAYLDMLKDRLDSLPEGKDVTVAITIHGMPWDRFPNEAWIQLAPAYKDKLVEECKTLVGNYPFGRTNVVICQDEFADPIWNPKKKWLSTNRAYWQAIDDNYDYVIGLPIEFFAENTDSLMHHPRKCYENFDQFSAENPIDYPDWSVPYTYEIVQGNTRVIYNGVPVGKYQKHVVEAFYQAIDSILSRK